MRKVHIVGIGGAGMSAIATVLLAMGHRVTGSDAAPSDRLRNLALAGAEVHVGHDPRWLRDADVVAVSTAIPPANAEVAEAGRRGLRVWRRAELLAAICRERRTVAIAGTHGKTTTSAMLAVILRHAGARPSYIVGGDLMGTTPGAAWEPGGEWLVVEADESDGTFLELGAEAVVVTSVEPDHLDFYGDIATLREAFVRFAAAAPGPRVLCADEPGARALAASLDPPGPGATGTAAPGAVTTYGTGSNATIRIEDVALGTAGAAFSLRTAGRRVATVWLRVPGLHNVRNADGCSHHGASPGSAMGGRGRGLAAVPRRGPAPRAAGGARRGHVRRRLRPSARGGHLRAGGGGRPVGSGGRGVPAPPLLPHRGPVAGLRRRLREGRRGHRDRHLSRRRAAPAGDHRPPDRRRRSRAPIPPWSFTTPRPSTTPPPCWRGSSAPAICVSPWAPVI